MIRATDPGDRLGLLLLDSIDEPHRSVAGDYQQLFAAVFGEAGVAIDFFDGRGDLPDPAARAGWIIPGSRQSVYDDLDWIHRLEDWTRRALDETVPLVGICFGHQLIARVLGARVEKAAVGWNVGNIEYEVTAQPAGLPPLAESFRLLASHQDQVLDLPAGAIGFAAAPTCPLAGFAIDDHVVTVQGHPEFVPDLAASLYRSRVERIGAAPIEQALATLDQPLDRVEMASWLGESSRASSGSTS